MASPVSDDGALAELPDGLDAVDEVAVALPAVAAG